MAAAVAHMRNLRHRSGRESWMDIAEWYELYQESLLGYVVQQTHSRHDAEDITQEAFLHLWFARSSGPIYNPKAFLFATALNLLKDHYRRAQTHATRTAVQLEDVEILDSSEPSQAIESDQALAQIVRTLGELRPSTQQAFLLGRIELFSHSQIASRLGVTVSMVEKHIAYAMAALEHTGFEQPRHDGGRRLRGGACKHLSLEPQPLNISV